MKKGMRVKVIKATDDSCLMECIGHTGIIKAILSDGGCGNTQEDPLYVVLFDEPFFCKEVGDVLDRESFWKEELQILN